MSTDLIEKPFNLNQTAGNVNQSEVGSSRAASDSMPEATKTSRRVLVVMLLTNVIA